MTIQDINARYVLPTVEEKTAYGYKRQDPYTKLFEERIIFLGQPIDDTVANDVMAQLLTLESMDPDRDIMIYINSPGGSFTALQLFMTLCNLCAQTSAPFAWVKQHLQQQ
jgi:ATP-dependent Clp protease, protease subunit